MGSGEAEGLPKQTKHLQELRDNIRHQIAAITQEELRVFENLKCRIDLCIGELGGHFQQLL